MNHARPNVIKIDDEHIPAELGVPDFQSSGILLVTFDWSTLIEMPYLLKQAGCQVDVLCPSFNLAIRNGYYDRWIDAGDSIDSLITSLVALVGDSDYRYVMIGDDPILWTIYRNRITPLWHLLPIKNESALPILHKIGLAEHCRQHGIPAPDFLRVESKECDFLSLGFPLVLKENYSSGGQGVRVFHDGPSYHAFLATYKFAEPLLAQRFIQGRNIAVEALFKNGRLLQYVCSEVLGDNYGPSSKRRYFPNDERIGTIIADMGNSAGLHGFVNMALVQEDSNQQYYLFEADPRPNKWVPYARWFGRDFATAFKIFLADGPGNCSYLPATSAQVDCWEVEHFSSYCVKLLNAGRYLDVIGHLLDFDRNLRYTIYDPLLLKAKMDALRQQIFPRSRPMAAGAAKPIAAPQAATGTFTINRQLEYLMPTIKIDDKEYDLDTLSDEAKNQVASMQFVDSELARLNAQIAVYQTARNGYAAALKDLLMKPLAI